MRRAVGDCCAFRVGGAMADRRALGNRGPGSVGIRYPNGVGPAARIGMSYRVRLTSALATPSVDD